MLSPTCHIICRIARLAPLTKHLTASEKISARIHQELRKSGIIDASNPLGIDTRRVTPKFAHQLAFISVGGQRKVVGMLFFWEAEVIRWRLLDQEEAEIESVLHGEGVTDEAKEELKVRLESVKMRRGMRPSQRSVGEGGQAQQTEGLPQDA